jgi:two-component system, chemotaxis family, protein-glutamate methylesterase/glutaminase
MPEPQCEIAVIGGSWGGSAAVSALLSHLTPACKLPVVVALHRGAAAPSATQDVLVNTLQRHSALPVVEAEDKTELQEGRVLVAPSDYHLLIEDHHVALTTEAPIRFSRPSIDALFESAADAYGERVAAVLLTGANDDGARGLVTVKKRGGITFVQDPKTAERAEMPEAAIATGAVDRVLPVTAIAAALESLGRRA